jgi:hypothetical protein
MTQIYLTGMVTDWDNPHQWHDEIREAWPDYTFTNGYEQNDFDYGDEEVYERYDEVVEPALEAVRESDGVLVRWGDDSALVGSTMEVKEAFDCGIPVVVWYDGWRDNLSPWLLHTSRGNFEDREKCMKTLLSFADSTDSFNFIHE